MNQDLVIVESKTVNNESVPVIINVAEVRHGEVVDKREISRSYVFEDFQAQIPLKYAKILLKDQPDEFRIVGAVSDNPSTAVKRAVKQAEEKAEGFVCDFCNAEAKSKAGLSAHIRYNHPEEFEKLYGNGDDSKDSDEESKEDEPETEEQTESEDETDEQETNQQTKQDFKEV